jgi:hypothetical protein
MNAPDRAADVRAICRDHPEAFGPPDDTNDARRLTFLRDILIPALNLMDGSWGVLTKQDQGGKQPCDVIVWRETREHFDVLTGTGATWIPHGVLTNAAWRWTPVPTLTPSPIPDLPPLVIPTPPAPPSAPIDPSAILAALARLDAALTALETRLSDLDAREPPTYRASLFGVTVVLHPDPPR